MKLILSLFPGIDLLGRGFEAEGFCVVRGPDLLFGQDVRGFHVPAGKFEGVIGGSPCQDFSGERRTAPTGNGEAMLKEFARLVREAAPDWWLLENVPRVPDVAVVGYTVQRIHISAREAGVRQLRWRCFQFGHRDAAPLVIRRRVTPAEEERRPRGASDDPRHPAVKPCGATERRGRNGGVPGLPCVFRPPRPVLGYAGWRYSFGHSPRSFSAAVTSNPAAGVIANPGGFGFFLWALRLIAIFCANSITAELPFDSALLIIQSAAQDRALLYPNRSPSKRVRTVVIAAFLRAISPSRSAFSLLLFIVNQYQKTNETGNLFAGSPFEETRRGGLVETSDAP